jgi:hypothetical protein
MGHLPHLGRAKSFPCNVVTLVTGLQLAFN